MKYILDILSDKSERIPYNIHDVPIYVGLGHLSNFMNFAASSHWHDDVEFSVILSGQMTYNINGSIYVIKEGDGVFINSRQFHNNYSVDYTDCKYICLVFHPLLLSANHFIERELIFPVIKNIAFPFITLSNEVVWHAKLLKTVSLIYELSMEKHTASNLLIQSHLFNIWYLLYTSMPETGQSYVQYNNRLSALHNMIGFLQKNFDNKISLLDIAYSGNISQSYCISIFNEYLHQTPIQYLTGYRLNRSADLLKNTAMNITEIALSSGFNGTSYYGEIFRKYFGCSPSEYRKRIT